MDFENSANNWWFYHLQFSLPEISYLASALLYFLPHFSYMCNAQSMDISRRPTRLRWPARSNQAPNKQRLFHRCLGVSNLVNWAWFGMRLCLCPCFWVWRPKRIICTLRIQPIIGTPKGKNVRENQICSVNCVATWAQEGCESRMRQWVEMEVLPWSVLEPLEENFLQVYVAIMFPLERD